MAMECEVCFEKFDDVLHRPKVLSCGHTQCLRCINQTRRCHVDRLNVADVDKLADNFYILSCVETHSASFRRFYCLNCKDVASSECENEHDICSLRKMRQNQVAPNLRKVQDSMEQQKAITSSLLELVSVVSEKLNELVEESMLKQDDLQHTLDRVQGVQETSGNQAAWEEAITALEQAARQCEERRPKLQGLLDLLHVGHGSRLQLELERRDSSPLAASVDLGLDCDSTRAIKFVLYLLSFSGKLLNPPDDANSLISNSEHDDEFEEAQDDEDDEAGASGPVLGARAERAQRALASASTSASNFVTLTRPRERRLLVAARRVASKQDKEREQRYALMLTLEGQDVVPSMEPFDCPVCLFSIEAGDGITLKGCLHTFCRDCIRGCIEHSNDVSVTCPYRDDEFSCECILTHREIKALVTPEVFEQYLERSAKAAENMMENTFHCKTPDCTGWCQFEVGVNEFFCPVCHHQNCLQCQVIHEPEDCREYQDRIKRQAATDEEARATQAALDAMLAAGDAMKCPKCTVVISKRTGCDALVCAMCKLNICWATKQARWGPKGPGDTSAGCRCNVNGRRCHPNCGNCH